MTDYRAFKMGPDGHLAAASRNFVCDNDEHAIEWAKQLFEDQPIELRSDDRLVKHLPSAGCRKPKPGLPRNSSRQD
jgi:hypothetical protein